jgi:mercuric ion binding protein
MFGDPSARGVPLEDPPNNECSGVAAQSGAVRFDHVRIVVVSAEDKTAVVTYDDRKAQVDALVKATTNAGYPSEPKG